MAETVKFEDMTVDEKLSAIYKECTKNRIEIEKIQRKIGKVQGGDGDNKTSKELIKIRTQLDGMVTKDELDKSRWSMERSISGIKSDVDHIRRFV